MQIDKIQQNILIYKIGRRRDEMVELMRSNVTPITDIVYRETKKLETYDEAIKATDYKPIEVGTDWGGGCTGWFKLKFSIPKEWKGREVAAHLNFGAEACAYIDGKPYQGIDVNHDEMVLTLNAKGGEKFEVIVDANSTAWWEPECEIKLKFSQAEIETRVPEMREYFFNMDMLRMLALVLPADSTRKAKIIYTLNKSVDAFDYTHKADEKSVIESAKRANKILKPLLDAKATESSTNISLNGHSHIDVAWLWPYDETRRKCARTFSSVMRMMEQYPEYIFTQSQAQLYEYTKECHPELYKEIKKKVKEGKWDVEGSMWVEADCNLSSGESLVRQVLVGKNFFKDEFDIDTKVLWLPDVFGYSAALPQILKKSGVDYFTTIKISWNQFNKFPYNTFYWQGIDGTKVLSHFPPAGDYNAYPEPGLLRRQVDMFAERDRSDWSLMSFGWGDGGGGADKRHLEYIRRAKNLEGLPKCKIQKVEDFFKTIDGFEDYPEWVGELYLELHRATYTTQARNKRFNRKAELMYRDAEFFSSVAAPMGLEYPYEELHKEWKRILCNQFHDVIPGSSIRQVYEDTDKMYPEILAFGEKTIDSALAKIASDIDTTCKGSAIVAFNTLPWGRIDVINAKLPAKGDYAVLDSEGVEIPSQIIGKEIRFTGTIPSMGYAVFTLAKRVPAAVENPLKVSKTSLENGFYKITLDNKGVIKSLIHKETDRELLPEDGKANLFQLFEDKPNDWPAWDIDFFYEDKWDDITDLTSIEVVEEGPVSAALKMVRKFNKSTLEQTMTIYADNPRIDFATKVDWQENDKVLKVSFPVDVNTNKARYEIQFGNVERDTHTNTSWDLARFEVCAHKWADVSEDGFGMSLMNDCKYGHHTKGNVMRLTLLRSATWPDAKADLGEQIFTYSIMPHSGDYIAADTVKQAYCLNVPVKTIVEKSHAGNLPKVMSFITVDADNVVLESVKKAERKNATILRFYECHNQRGPVTVKVDLPFKKICECNLMEEKIADIESVDGVFTFDIMPFEIKTFELK